MGHKWNVSELVENFVAGSNTDLTVAMDKLKAQETEKRSDLLGLIVERVVSRLKLIEVLHTDETHGPLIDAGFDSETSLRLYLIMTCFDLMGQDEPKFLDWTSWITKDSEYRTEFLKGLKFDEIEDSDSFLKAVQAMDEHYKAKYGVRKAFKRFFNTMISSDSKAKILDHIWITKNLNGIGKGIHSHYLLDPPKYWIEKPEETRFKHVINELEVRIRNAFTHGLRMSSDRYDKDPLMPAFREIWESLKKNGAITFLEEREQLDGKVIRDGIGYNGYSVGTDGNTVFVVRKDEDSGKTDKEIETKLVTSFSEHVVMMEHRLIKGGDMFEDALDDKKVLCFRGISITKFLENLAKEGAEKYVEKLASRL